MAEHSGRLRQASQCLTAAFHADHTMQSWKTCHSEAVRGMWPSRQHTPRALPATQGRNPIPSLMGIQNMRAYLTPCRSTLCCSQHREFLPANPSPFGCDRCTVGNARHRGRSRLPTFDLTRPTPPTSLAMASSSSFSWTQSEDAVEVQVPLMGCKASNVALHGACAECGVSTQHPVNATAC